MLLNKYNNISFHGVREFWIYWTLHVHLWNIWEISIISLIFGHFTNLATDFHKISIISSNEGGNRWTIDEISGFYGIFQIFPGSTQAKVPKPC